MFCDVHRPGPPPPAPSHESCLGFHPSSRGPAWPSGFCFRILSDFAVQAAIGHGAHSCALCQGLQPWQERQHPAGVCVRSICCSSVAQCPAASLAAGVCVDRLTSSPPSSHSVAPQVSGASSGGGPPRGRSGQSLPSPRGPGRGPVPTLSGLGVVT